MSSDQQPIEVSFELALADVLAARRFLLLRSTAGWVLSAAVVVLLAQVASHGAWIPLVAAVAGIALVGWWLLYLHPRRAFLSSPSRGGRQTWVLGPDGLSFDVKAADGTPLGTSEISWRSVTRVRESSRAFLLSSSRQVAYVLPKRALDPTDVDRVRALLVANVASRS